MTVSAGKQSWFAVRAKGHPDAVDALESGFAVLNAGGIETDQLGKGPRDEITVIGYFVEPVSLEVVEQKLTGALEAFGLPTDHLIDVSSKRVEDRDWLSEWKKHWKSVRSGPFVIAPPWETETGESADAHLIRIEPSMAFGTGTHETTRLCLEAIGSFYEPGMSFLDVGTGTGVLSIAAAMMSDEATSIRACDVDHDSISIAKENAKANGVEFIKFEVGTLSPDAGRYDFVCANMTIDIIGPMANELFAVTRRTLVLSGILNEQESQARDMLSEVGTDAVETTRMGEWLAMVVRR